MNRPTLGRRGLIAVLASIGVLGAAAAAAYVWVRYHRRDRRPPPPSPAIERIERESHAPSTHDNALPGFVHNGSWKAMWVSVPGTSHARSGQPCQDAAYGKVSRGHVFVAAVADGAGSAPHGGRGAQIAVRAAVDTISDRLADSKADVQQWQRYLTAAMRVAHAEIEIAAAAHNTKSRDFATTLLLFVAMADVVVAAQVGDGCIVVQGPDGKLSALTSPQGGEYANTTTFLVSPDAHEVVQTRVWRGPYRGVAAFTDGLQRLALDMPKAVPHAPFFAPLFDFADSVTSGEKAVGELSEFLKSSKVKDRADDDLTLLLLNVRR